jgi:triosephosphate isomerase
MRTLFVAGNWKMHGDKSFIKGLVTDLNKEVADVEGVNVAVCPPAIYLDYVARCLNSDKVQLGAQNIAVEPKQGAFTGEISVSMIKDVGCSYVVLGHSERRSIYGETNTQVAEKVETALNAGVTPILCVGETLDERESGKLEVVISGQLNAVLDRVGIDRFENVVIAYEPVWAIGTGKTASSAQAQEVHLFIRSLLAELNATVAEKVIIQYGGSVKPENAKELFSQPDIDGGLIGGASLNASDFVAICKAGA